MEVNQGQSSVALLRTNLIGFHCLVVFLSSNMIGFQIKATHEGARSKGQRGTGKL